MEDDQEIGAYMFRRTVPSMHLTPEDVRWMVCLYFNISTHIYIYRYIILQDKIRKLKFDRLVHGGTG